MEEIFGFVKAKCSHPYCKIVKNYIPSEFDIIGIYYPHGKGVNFIVYDVYSKRELRNVIMQELLNWQYIEEVKTCKFQIVDDEVRNSFVASILKTSESVLEKCIKKNKRSKFLFEKESDKTTSESSYNRNTKGSSSKVFEDFYTELHRELFYILETFSLKGLEVFPTKYR